jgi:pSer/pThr/pTyr-binding forkhead associated (FHA) protein
MDESWLIGAAADCDIVVDRPEVSGRHCRLSRGAGGYTLTDLGSTNGTFVNGARLAGEIRVVPGDAITLGRSIPMPWPTESTGPARQLRLGRDPDNDLVVDLPIVSGRHALVGWDGSPGRGWIEDLGSSNGVCVGRPGRRAGRQAFGAADTVFLGSQPVAGAWLLARLGAVAPGRLTFRGDAMTLGRDPGCEAVVDDPRVSARHARLFRAGGAILIEDLGPPGGTFVNGRPISGRVAVAEGDLIGLGGRTLVLSVEAGAANAEPGRHAAGIARPAWLAGLLGHAILVALAILALGRPGVLPGGKGAARAAESVDSWVALAAVWFGLAASLVARWLEPRRGGMSADPGASEELRRLGLAGGASLAQCLLAWAVVAPVAGLGASWGPAVALMALASFAGLALGELIGVLRPRPRDAAVAAAAAALVMYLFGAVQSPLRPAGGAGLLAEAMPSRWAFEGLLLLEADGAAPGAPDPAEGAFPAATSRSGMRACVLALGLLALGLGGAAAFIGRGPGSRPRPSSPSRGGTGR